MATVYAFIYGRPPKQFFAWLEERKLQQQQRKRQLEQEAAQQKAPGLLQPPKGQQQQQLKEKVELRAPVTLDADAEVSFVQPRQG
jgi:hypothetical protein